MRRAGVLGLLVLTFILLLPGAVAHGPGAISTHLEGSLGLGPSGTQGNVALLDLSALGEVGTGDELRYFWESNAGQGPAVRFEILREMPGLPVERVYGVTAATQTETWMIPAQADYTASWENPSSEAITLSYLFEVVPPIDTPVAFDWPLVLGLGVAGVVFAFLFVWGGRRKARDTGPSGSVEEKGPREK